MRPILTTPPTTERTWATPASDSSYVAGVMGAVSVLALVLSARLIVLIAIVGAIGLAWVALANPDPYRIAVLAAYLLAGLVPCVWLSSRGK